MNGLTLRQQKQQKNQDTHIPNLPKYKEEEDN